MFTFPSCIFLLLIPSLLQKLWPQLTSPGCCLFFHHRFPIKAPYFCSLIRLSQKHIWPAPPYQRKTSVYSTLIIILSRTPQPSDILIQNQWSAIPVGAQSPLCLPQGNSSPLQLKRKRNHHSPCVCSFPGPVFADPAPSLLFQYCSAVSVPSPPAYVQPAAGHPPWKGRKYRRYECTLCGSSELSLKLQAKTTPASPSPRSTSSVCLFLPEQPCLYPDSCTQISLVNTFKLSSQIFATKMQIFFF